MGLPVIMTRIAKLREEGKITKGNGSVPQDIFESFEYNYEPHSFQTEQGICYILILIILTFI